MTFDEWMAEEYGITPAQFRKHFRLIGSIQPFGTHLADAFEAGYQSGYANGVEDQAKLEKQLREES